MGVKILNMINNLQRKKTLIPLILMSFFVLLITCGENNITNNNGQDPGIDSTYIGTDSTLDVMTWNIEHFPLSGAETVEKVIEIVKILNLDIIVLQEIESASSFETVVESIDNWEGYRATGAYYDINLAVIYNTETITIDNIESIFEDDSWAFPRSPLLIDCFYGGENYIVINNHLKAGGDNEDEERRQAACDSLKQYLDDNYSDERVILLGDLNDSLTDPQYDNVFWEFIADSLNYQFADMSIAQGSISYWSYPGWPSHLDHILITDELFDAWQSGSTMTLLLDNYFDDYLYDVSDHRPVLVKLNIEP